MEKIQLRPFENEDIAIFEKWLYLPHVAKWYHEPLDWIEEVKNRHGEFSFIHHFIAELNENAIGFCQYYEYCMGGETWHGDTDMDGTYSIDYLIGDTAYLGMGYGKSIVHLLIEKIKQQKNAKRIIAQPEQDNKASCALLLSCGFSFEPQNKIYVKQFS